MATDLAEFVGAAIALNLLFGVPLFAAGLITGVVAFGILALQTRGYRTLRGGDRRDARGDPAGLPVRDAAHRWRRPAVLHGFVPGFEGSDSPCCWPPGSSARP